MSLRQCRFCYRIANHGEKRCARCAQHLRDPLHPRHLAAALVRDRKTLGLLLLGSLAGALLLFMGIGLFFQGWLL